MKILLISDAPHAFVDVEDKRKYKWDDKLPEYMGTNDAIILDFSFINRERILTIKQNLNFLQEVLTEKTIDQDNLIIVVVCGSKNEEYFEKPKSTGEESTEDKPEKIYSYDFLNNIIPEYEKRVEFCDCERDFEQLSVKHISIRQYLDLAHKYYLFFRYNSDAESCVNIFPLAKTKKGSNACVAFEHRIKRGIVIILPGYDDDKIGKAGSSLIKICKNYFKVREDCSELELDLQIPQQIKDNYTEALICFLNDLFSSSCVASGRALEAILKIIGAKGKTPHKQIDFIKNFLHPKTLKLLTEIRVLRNAEAHFDFDSTPVDEKDAKNMLLFLKQVLHDIQPIEFTKERIQEMEKEVPNE